MSEFLGSAWWLLVTLGILVTFHEFGHFWVARRCGVKVLRFSIGFGKPLWSRVGRDGVEYAIGAIPLGGYVKFLDAREADDPELLRGKPGEYSTAPVWHRIAIAAAGPLFNIAFTVFAFWAMFVVGRPDLQPIIGAPSGLAAEAGFVAGDRMTAVGGDHVDSLSAAMLDVGQAAMLRQDIPVAVVDAEGRAHTRVLPLSKLPADVDENKVFDAIGLTPQPPPALVGTVVAGSPAEHAGMLPGDRIVRIGQTPVANWGELVHAVSAEAAKDPHLDVLVRRGGSDIPLQLTATREGEGDAKRWMIGIGARNLNTAVEHYGPLQAVPAAVRETWKTARNTLGMIGSMLTGQASTKNLSSVITIARVANRSAQEGLAWFLSFLAVISLSLGILNLLPIPILDGGHLLYYFIEIVKGRPLSERALIAGQYVGLALLVALMSLAFYNDIVRIVAS